MGRQSRDEYAKVHMKRLVNAEAKGHTRREGQHKANPPSYRGPAPGPPLRLERDPKELFPRIGDEEYAIRSSHVRHCHQRTYEDASMAGFRGEVSPRLVDDRRLGCIAFKRQTVQFMHASSILPRFPGSDALGPPRFRAGIRELHVLMMSMMLLYTKGENNEDDSSSGSDHSRTRNSAVMMMRQSRPKKEKQADDTDYFQYAIYPAPSISVADGLERLH
nr:hypothetical protein CFP56_62447 [Quercus suber]